MKFSCLSFLLAQSALASRSSLKIVDNLKSIPVESKSGMSILSKARKLNNNENEEDLSWMVGYSIKFDSCHTIRNVYGVEGAREAESSLGNQELVKFKLCPTDRCSVSCYNSAEYVIEMREFLESFTEAKQDMEERACETAKETCETYCDDFDDDANDDEYCLNQCLNSAGMEQCVENNGDDDNEEEEFDMQEYAECKEIEYGDDDGGPQYYIGAYCNSYGTKVNLGVFEDASCTSLSRTDIYQTMYGKELPYKTQSLVDSTCISCVEEDDNDDDGSPETNEFCQQLHEESAGCEKNLKISAYAAYYTASTEACTFISKTLPALVQVSKSDGSALYVAQTFAWLFAISSLGLGFLAYYFHKIALKSPVSGISLMDGERSEQGTLA